MPLSDTAVRAAGKRDKDYKLTDSGGLYLLVKSTGSKLWRYDYRFDGKRKTMALGSYKTVSLAQARKKHETARNKVADGIDPMVAEPEPLADNLFRTVGEAWHAARATGWNQRHADRVLNRLRRNLFVPLGAKAIDSISTAEVLTALHAVEKRGALSATHKIKNYASNIFEFGKGLGLLSANPVDNITKAKLLKTPPKSKRRAAIKESEFPTFFARFAESGEERDTSDALRLTIYTAVRTSETRFAAAEEMEGLDGPEPMWRLSPDRMKMGVEHLVPLSRQAANIIRRRMTLVGGKGLLFPKKTVSGVISENTMLFALYRMGYHSKATVHGFRGSFSTILNEQTHMVNDMEVRTFDKDWIERQLAHVEENEVRGAYNAAEWIGPRRSMLQWWADWLDRQEEIGRLLG